METDRAMTWAAVIFIVGLLWMFMNPANPPADTPSEHKCWVADVGYERC
jgi:hypothetical protein